MSLRNRLYQLLVSTFSLVAIACTAEDALKPSGQDPVTVVDVPFEPANVGMCGGGTGIDQYPDAPGVFLCTQMTYAYCTDSANTDQDQDGLADYCEEQLSYAFRPELRYSRYLDDVRGEPYWVARQDSVGHVIVGYLFSYYRDLGSVQYSCTPPLAIKQEWGCHNGDSESIWLWLSFDPATSHWVLTSAAYSQHDTWEQKSPSVLGYADLEYSGHVGSHPRVWVSEKKHANYFSQDACNYGHLRLFAWDWCADADTTARLAWSAYWNIGSQATPLVNGVLSRDQTYEYFGQGRRECYWTERPFRGWVPDNIGGWEAGSYLSKLNHWGFSTSQGVASCDPPPPPPPPAPLSAYIVVLDAPDYRVHATGGTPPYSYLWEVCGIDCDGGGGPLLLRGDYEPDTWVHGWQFYSTSWAIYWDSSEWYLRLTVTDAVGQQVTSEYYVP